MLSARLYLAKPEFNEVTGVALYRRVLDHVRTLPGVQNATLSYASPVIGMSECVVPDERRSSPEAIVARANISGPGYFSTFGLPLVRGRDFLSSDNSAERPVVIVNEALVRRYWPGQNPIGSRIRFGDDCEKGLGTAAEIVGVAKDAGYTSLDASVRPYIFLPFEQNFVGYVALVVRTQYNPARLASVLRKDLHGVDTRLRIYEIETVAEQMDRSLWQTRLEASLLGVFGTLALLIAAVGLYGVIAFAARKRAREFGIRMALGAQRRDVLWLVTGDALAITLAGIGPGLLLSLAATKLLRGLLFGLSPTDSATYGGAALVWTLVSLLASCVPAYLATRADPSIALRDE